MSGSSSSPRDRQSWRSDLAIAVLVWLVAATGLSVFTWWRGQDINYDLMNYHRFTTAAALSEEPFRHIAGLQQFLNPFLYLPHFVLNAMMSPFRAAVAITWIQALNIPLLYIMSLLVLKGADISLPARRVMALLGAAAGVFGPMFLTETGSSFADSLASLPILAGLCLLLIATDTPDRRTALLFGAGLLFGVSVGLKLTNAGFALGAVVALLAIAGWRARFPAFAALASGGALGGVMANGYWSHQLWRHFGSPIFPFYNSIFKSPFYPPENTVDRRFLPEGLADALSYPFQWVVGLHPSSELPFRDLRFAVLSVLLVALLAVSLWRVARAQAGGISQGTLPAAASFRGRSAALVLFSVTGYGLWIGLFAIQRYLTPIELIAGPALIAMLVLLRIPARVLAVAAGSLMIAIGAWTRPSDFGHSVWTYDVTRTHLPAEILDSNGIFLLLGDPTTYVIADFGDRTRFFNIGMIPDPGNRMGDLFRDALARHDGPVYSIQGEPMSKRTLDFLNAFRLRQDGIDCRHFGTDIGARVVGLGLCSVTANPRATDTTAMTYPLGRVIAFAGPHRNSVFYEVSGWGAETAAGRAWAQDARSVRMHFEIADRPPPRMLATMRFAAPVDRCNIEIALNKIEIEADFERGDCIDDVLSFSVSDNMIAPSGEFDLHFSLKHPVSAPVIASTFRLVPR